METLRRQVLGDTSWSIDEHYLVSGGFVLSPAQARGEVPVTLAFAAGNLAIPNLAVIEVNETPIHFRAPPARAPYSGWSGSRAREYRVEVDLPPALLRTGPNHVRITARMLPGLVDLGGVDQLDGIHNMSLDHVTLVVGE